MTANQVNQQMYAQGKEVQQNDEENDDYSEDQFDNTEEQQQK